jgi:hypothetical protein
MLLDFIDPFYFVVALAVGLLYTYLASPVPELIIKYPTPHNAGKITYKDDAGVCYKYKVKESQCPSDPNKIKEMPLHQN